MFIKKEIYESDPDLFFPVSVCVPIFSEKYTLILQKTKKHKLYPSLWGFPAGKLETGETPEKCALREFEEETKITVSYANPLQPPCIFYHRHQRLNGDRFYFYSHNFFVFLNGQKYDIALDLSEHARFAFIPLKKILQADESDFVPDSIMALRLTITQNQGIAKLFS